MDPIMTGEMERAQRLDGFTALIGPLRIARDGDALAFGFEVGPQHLNAGGRVHGGMIASLADHALGLTVWEAIGRQSCATIQLTIQYVSAATLGEFLEARGEVIRATRSVVFIRGLVMAGERIVATADGVWKRLGRP